MGQLTNQFVSQSYQGLLNLANANTGFTTNLQTITDGLGGSSPLQMSQTQVNISGTFTVNGSPVAADTGSLVTTSSFNAFTSSVDLRFDGIELETGSLQNQINQKLDTGSFNTYTSSNDSKVNSLIANTGSYATTSSLTAVSQSIAATDLAQNNRLTAIESITGSIATTGSLNSYTLTSSFNAYTSSNDTKVNDLISKTGSYATTSSLNSLSQSIATTDLGQDNRLGSLESKTGSYATTGSNIFNGDQTITGSVNITGNISATSASFTYVNTVYETASVIYSSGSNQFGDASNDVQTLWGRVNIPTGPVSVTGSVIATNFTGSLQGTASFATTTVSSSFAQNALSSSFAGNAGQLSGISGSLYARRNVTNTFTADQTIQSGSELFVNMIETGNSERLVFLSDGNPGSGGGRFIFADRPTGGGFPYDDTTVDITGSLRVTAGITGSLLGNASSATNATNFSNRGIAQFALTGSNSFNGNQTITGSVTASAGFVGNLTGTASFATNALSASWAPDTTNTGSFMITGSVSGPTSTFTKGDGSQFSLTVNNVQSASFATNADTASYFSGTIPSSSYATNAATASIAYDVVVYGKCDNAGGLTRGTIVRITGANGDNPLFNSASWTDDFNSANTLGMLSEDVAYNGFANVVVQGKVIGINTDGMNAGDLLFLSSSGQYTTSSVPAPYHEVRLGQVLRANLNNGSAYVTIDNGYELTELHDVDIQSVQVGDVLTYVSGAYGQWVNKTVDELGYLQTSSFNSYTASMDARTGSYATTGSNSFNGNQTITGSVTISGSAQVELDVKGDVNITGSLYDRGDLYIINPNQTNNFSHVSSSNNGNLLFGWEGQNNQAVLTSSLVISGSNNIINVLKPVTAGYYGYVSGSNNIALGLNGIQLSTGSLLRPVTTSNIVNSGNIQLLFNSSSVAGGQPTITNNIVNSQFFVNMGASGSITATNNIINGATSVLQTGSAIANLRTTFQANNVNSTFTVQNFASSSLTVNNSNTVGASHSITNEWINGFGTTGPAASRNFIQGQLNFISFSGSPSNNTARGVGDNFIGGNFVGIRAWASGSNAGNAYGTLIYGYNLIANANSTGIFGGSAFLGRFNDTGSALSSTNDIVLAVGTGTAAGARRTGFYITTGSLVGVSGSMIVNGQAQMSGNSGFPLYVTGTIQTQRLHFDGNPFNSNPASSLGAIRYDGNNENLSISNYNKAEITSGSFSELYLSTGSNYAHSKQLANYANTSAVTTLSNSNGTRVYDVNVDRTTITGSVNISSVMNMRPLDPLPAGNIGDLAVSSSNQLYFYNGVWTLVV